MSFFGLNTMESSALFSDDKQYRYRLVRTWKSDLPTVAFIMLNPSKAGAFINDPTVRRCIGFAKRWGYGGIIVGNLFAYCATDPRELLKVEDPIGPDNEFHLRWICSNVKTVVCAWGQGGQYMERDYDFLDLCCVNWRMPVSCIALTSYAHPRHPVRAPYTDHPVLYRKVGGAPAHA